jgi:hypothetical protein
MQNSFSSKTIFLLFNLALFTTSLEADTKPLAVDDVLTAYVTALGGMEAVDRIQTRVVHGKRHHAGPVTLYWKKPDLVLSVAKEEREGYDGRSGWILSKRKKVKRMARGAQIPLQMDANPLRYGELRKLYSDLDAGPREDLAGERMDVLIAPNSIAATKFFFDAKSHLLRRIEESGETSAYFKLSVDFLDYREVDGVKFPFHIVHETTEPGGSREDLAVKEVEHNVDLRPEAFSKPTSSVVVMGGKR